MVEKIGLGTVILWNSRSLAEIAAHGKCRRYKHHIRHLHLSHNKSCLPPKILHKHNLHFLLRRLQYPARTKIKGYAKFGRRKRGGGGGVEVGKQGVLWEMCNGEWNKWHSSHPTPPRDWKPTLGPFLGLTHKTSWWLWISSDSWSMKYAFNIENFSLSWLKDKRMMNETRFIAGYNLKQGLLVFKLMNG